MHSGIVSSEKPDIPTEDAANLSCLVYVSAARGEMPGFDIGELLRQSRDNNQQKRITGLLLYAEGNFMQAIEGESDTIERLFQRIRQDPRHTNFLVLARFPLAKRQFGNWSMAFRAERDLSPEDRAEMNASLSKWSLDPLAPSVLEEVRIFLHGFLGTM